MISSPARADDVNSQNSSRSIDLRSPTSQDDQITNDLPSNMNTPTGHFVKPVVAIRSVVAILSGHCVPLSTATTDVFSIRPYISYQSITLHALATRIRRGDASMKNVLWWAGRETR